MISPQDVPVNRIDWTGAVRIIRSVYPPIDLFEDIAAPEDWPLLISAEQKTNPRLIETIGNLDLISPHRRVGGQGASYLMAPFTHTSTDRPAGFQTVAAVCFMLRAILKQRFTRPFTTIHGSWRPRRNRRAGHPNSANWCWMFTPVCMTCAD